PALPIILGHAILDTEDRVRIDPAAKHIQQLVRTEVAQSSADLQAIFAGLVKMRAGNIQGDTGIAPGLKARLVDGFEHDLKRLFIALQAWAETAFIADEITFKSAARQHFT